MRLAVDLTLLAWLLAEFTLLARDLARGKRTTARDRGTRSLLVIGWFAAFVAAVWVSGQFGPGSAWRLGDGHIAVGLMLMWIGLAIRIWAVTVLGSAFRTTVEVDADQPLVDRGPYRLVRHPSYSGLLLIAVGYGVTLGNWLSVIILLVIPLATMLRRIAVEEATLTDVIGQPYVAYKERTKKLVPGLW